MRAEQLLVEEEDEEKKKKSKVRKREREKSREKIEEQHDSAIEKKERKLFIPSLFFKETNISEELSLLAFKKKLLKRKLLLQKISLEKIDIEKEISLIRYKRAILKKKIVLSPIAFSEVPINTKVSILAYTKRMKVTKIILPPIKFLEITSLLQLTGLAYHYEIKEGEEPLKREKIIIKEGEELGIGVGGEGREENLLDVIFERKRWGRDVINSREPHIIFLIEGERETGGVKEIVKSILQRIIEEMEGEFEGIREESIVDIVEKREKEKERGREEEREKEVERYLDILRKIFIVNMEEISYIEKFDLVSLVDRINELKGKGTGFLIFCLKKGKLDDIEEKCEKLFDQLTYQPNVHIWKLKRNVPLNIVGKVVGFSYSTLRSILLSQDSKKFLISTLPKAETPDFLFELGRKLQLKEREMIRAFLCDIVKRNKDEESQLHYDLKCLVVYKLIKDMFQTEKVEEGLLFRELNNILQTIKTEHKIGKEDTIISDIVREKNGIREVWEIETLFSEGKKGGIPTKKIDETIEKYLGENGNLKVNKINVVIDNLTFYLHSSELRRKILMWVERLGERIDFWTANWEKKELTCISRNMDISKA